MVHPTSPDWWIRFWGSCKSAQILSHTEHPELRKGRRRWFIPFKKTGRSSVQPYLLLNLHHYSGFSCHPQCSLISRWICTTIWILMPLFRTAIVYQERSKLMRSVLWLLHYNISSSRPTGSHEGLVVLQWRHLCILLPSTPLSASWQYMKDRIGCSCRRSWRVPPRLLYYFFSILC